AHGLLEGLFRAPGGEQVEDPEALVGAGRSIEPGDERATAPLRLADAESEAIVQPAVSPAIPDRAQVLGQVAWGEKLVRRRKTGDRSRIALRDQEAVPDQERAVWVARVGFRALEFPLRIHPGEAKFA